MAKGLYTFGPLGDFVEPSKSGHGPFELLLKVNGEIRQKGSTQDMVFSVSHLIAYLSKWFGLHPGDLIFTGTPEGVGPVEIDDKLTAELGKGLSKIEVDILQESTV